MESDVGRGVLVDEDVSEEKPTAEETVTEIRGEASDGPTVATVRRRLH